MWLLGGFKLSIRTYIIFLLDSAVLSLNLKFKNFETINRNQEDELVLQKRWAWLRKKEFELKELN